MVKKHTHSCGESSNLGYMRVMITKITMYIIVGKGNQPR